MAKENKEELKATDLSVDISKARIIQLEVLDNLRDNIDHVELFDN